MVECLVVGTVEGASYADGVALVWTKLGKSVGYSGGKYIDGEAEE